MLNNYLNIIFKQAHFSFPEIHCTCFSFTFTKILSHVQNYHMIWLNLPFYGFSGSNVYSALVEWMLDPSGGETLCSIIHVYKRRKSQLVLIL